MASIEVKQISSSCKKCMRVSFSLYKKYANQCLCIYVAHTAFCVFILYGSKLRMRVVKTFELRQQSADDCLRIFVHRDIQLPWVYCTTRTHECFRWSKWRTGYFRPFSRACFRVVKAGGILVPAPATGHRGQRYDGSCTHASLFWDACMLIMLWKR